jgi:hypothetical protein
MRDAGRCAGERPQCTKRREVADAGARPKRVRRAGRDVGGSEAEHGRGKSYRRYCLGRTPSWVTRTRFATDLA